ncbi:hypothetical protein COR50_16915 [Chitinophaga caeni]|uniref:CHRD domain-containing protein n=2 Tax=Chitinophaga caeni TaxID=2029983 RepID=A0A291QXQ0_9BACT|nr:hypothetical protein COR50_16915 [Chitinophaga caeni]
MASVKIAYHYQFAFTKTITMRLNPTYIFIMLLGACTFMGCDKEDHPEGFVMKFWNVQLSGANVVPSSEGNNSHAYALLYLRDDYQLYYDIYFDSLSKGSSPGVVEIRMGNAIENGETILTLDGNFQDGKLKGNVDFPKSLADSAINNDAYITVAGAGNGALARGQLAKEVVYTLDLPLTGDQVVPGVSTTATGTAYLRITEDFSVYFAIDCKNVPAGETLTGAHLHSATGDMLFNFASGPADFNVPKSGEGSNDILNALKKDAVYIDVHSDQHPDGLLRGNLR